MPSIYFGVDRVVGCEVVREWSLGVRLEDDAASIAGPMRNTAGFGTLGE